MMEPELLGCHDIDLVPKTDSEIIASVEKEWPWTDELKAKLKATKIVGTKNPDLDFSKTDWIESRKDKRWMGYNEVCAYLHSGADVKPNQRLAILLNYDPHYCRYFGTKPSKWTLELSDGFRKKLGGGSIDLHRRQENRQCAAITAGARDPGRPGDENDRNQKCRMNNVVSDLENVVLY